MTSKLGFLALVMGFVHAFASEACSGDERLTGENGDLYRGCQDKSWQGDTCQKWSSQSPHTHTKLTNETHNYCRNPDGAMASIWCYTTHPKRRRALCSPACGMVAEQSECEAIKHMTTSTVAACEFKDGKCKKACVDDDVALSAAAAVMGIKVKKCAIKAIKNNMCKSKGMKDYLAFLCPVTCEAECAQTTTTTTTTSTSTTLAESGQDEAVGRSHRSFSVGWVPLIVLIGLISSHLASMSMSRHPL